MKVDVLPLYKCHKVVRAAKIEWIDARPETVEEQGTPLMSLNYGISGQMCAISEDFIQKHNPKKGGYLVVYEDGYLSYSPASAFEAGYRQLEPVGCSSGSVGGEAAAAPTNTGFQWRKKPVVIEAFQWTGGPEQAGEPEWIVDAIKAGDVGIDSDGLNIVTLEGVLTASRGDWIIRGIKGELYPCKPDIFAATYEPVDEPATNMMGATGGPLAEIDLSAADFSDALMWLKEGKRVQRAGWNGKGQYVILIPGDHLARSAGYGFGEAIGEFTFGNVLALKNAQNIMQPGWVPSMGDLMATDWQVMRDNVITAPSYKYRSEDGSITALVIVENALPHQVRVIDEYNDLDNRLVKLTSFFDTETYRSLDVDERGRLKEQSLMMGEYLRILAERIKAFC